jgi:hypothetical protein
MLLGAAFAGEPKKSRLFRLIFWGGTATRRAGEAGSRACVHKAHGTLCPLRARENRGEKGDVTERVKPTDRLKTNQKRRSQWARQFLGP